MTKKQRQKRATKILEGVNDGIVLQEPELCPDCGGGIIGWLMDGEARKSRVHCTIDGNALIMQKWVDIECLPF